MKRSYVQMHVALLSLVGPACTASPDLDEPAPAVEDLTVTSDHLNETQCTEADTALQDADSWCRRFILNDLTVPNLSPSSPRAVLPTAQMGTRDTNGCIDFVNLYTAPAPLAGPTPGFCRAELNYCKGNELRLKAESLAAPPSDRAVRQRILQMARDHLQAAATEYASSFSIYTNICLGPMGAPGFYGMRVPQECTRLSTSPTFATTLASRMEDATRQLAEVLRLETRSRMAAGDGLARPNFDGDGDYLQALWGPGRGGEDPCGKGAGLPDGERYGAAESLMGFSRPSPGAQRGADFASALQNDDQPSLILTLASEFEVPTGYAEQGARRFFHDDPMLAEPLYNLLDHRIAAAWRLGPYRVQRVSPGGPIVPDLAGDALRARTPVTETALRALTPLASSFSPLRHRYGVAPDQFRAAMSLTRDLLSTTDIDFTSRRQVTSIGGDPSLHLRAMRLIALEQRNVVSLATDLADIPSSFGVEVADPTIAVIPFGAPPGAITTASNWYAWDGARVGELGAAGGVHQLRVWLYRLRKQVSITPVAPFVSAASLDTTLGLTTTYVGEVWTEVNTRELSCRFPMLPAPPTGDPLCPAGPCDPECREGRYMATASDPTWSIYFPPGSRFDVTTADVIRQPVAVVASTAEAAERHVLCLVRGRAPGADPAGGPPCPASAMLTERPPADDVFPGVRRRTYKLPGTTFDIYILWQSGPAEYELIDVVNTGRASANVHAVGGEFGDMLAEVMAKDIANPGTPTESVLGLPYDLIPPLENELTEDGDLIEDSHAMYTRVAEEAAARATAQLTQARDMEIESLQNLRADAALQDQAEAAESAVITEVCGGGTAADCAVDRIASIAMGAINRTDPGTGRLEPLLPPVPLDPAIDRMTERPMAPALSCRDFLPQVAQLFVLPSDDDDWRRYIEDFMGYSLDCVEFVVLQDAHALTIHDIPRRVIDEMERGGIGDFTDLEGLVRDEHNRMFSRLEAVRVAVRDFQDELVIANRRVTSTARIVHRERDTSLAEIGCMIGKWAVATGVVAAGVATGGVAAVGAVIVAGAIVTTAHEECTGGDARAREVAEEGFVGLLQSLSRLRSLLDVLGQNIRALALGDSALDRLERLAEQAELQRQIQARIIATNSLADMPEWQTLRGFRVRRARDSLFRAQQRAFIARRAIEFRFGYDLSRMTTDEPFVDAPASWTNDVFTLDAATETSGLTVISIAGEEIDLYVQRLEDFVFGYPFRRRFSEGSDRQILNMAPLGVLTTLAGDATLTFPEQLSYRCANGDWIVGALLGTSEPCVAPGQGGVDYAEVSFAVPPQLSGYTAERLARDNFNYRMRSVAVNVVGSAVIDCSVVPVWRRSECYAGGNIQYTLRQEGLVSVENHDREAFLFSMEPGVIQRSRALAAERVLTNPLSTADANLVLPYERFEMWGRPLSGIYTLRLFGAPQVVWQHVEDIQVLTRYDYWTRQE